MGQQFTRELMAEFEAVSGDGTTYTVKAHRNRALPGAAFDIGEPSADPAAWQYTASVKGTNVGLHARRLAKGRYELIDSKLALATSDPREP
ncbi:hypothetical protein GobsT_37330 [Gemmata obscuriglobus]|nr:hypothetical protein [Gemmata obscuriglobus]QEG28944.1 hypothetical protein GobsT_37330 [Gemmata obscuriglobus]VTS07463.1 unnamed protein product [Gemmata obscuriglobus UQM 2246]